MESGGTQERSKLKSSNRFSVASPLHFYILHIPFNDLSEGCAVRINLSLQHYMGGVFNAANVGLNYNLVTGKELALTDVFSLSPNEIADYLKKQTKAYIDANSNKGWWDDAKLTVDRYTMDQYEYYIDGKNVCLCYPVYELGPGAMGPVIFKCPIV